MSWLQQLYETYCYNEHLAGNSSIKPPLVLPAHITQKAQITLEVDLEGNFCGATAVDKDDCVTVIPVTEDSGGRANIIAPHALCDMLPYVAGDYADYVSTEKERKKAREKYAAYLNGLRAWADSEYTHPKIKAILAYIENACMIQDLIQNGLVKLDANGVLDKSKISGATYDKALVRFCVLGAMPQNVWEDRELFLRYGAYRASIAGEKTDICYISGENRAVCTKHPKGVVANDYGAKLISANDTSNFVFRGRFETAEQALAVSNEVSQKAHAALTWLVKKQGVTHGKRTFLCWNPAGKDIRQPDAFDDDEEDTENEDNTVAAWRIKLKNALKGYRDALTDTDQIVIISLEAATTGRLSVTYYNELAGSDYYDRIERWSGFLHWKYLDFSKESNGIPVRISKTPSLGTIIKCAYGTERGKNLDVDDKLFSEQYQRLLHCMLDSQPIPKDLRHALFIKVCNPMRYHWEKGHSFNFEMLLSTACAVIAKDSYDTKGEVIEVMLDGKNTNRSYLFGRLLAVADRAERQALDKNEQRETNAMRLWSAYVNHPLMTFTTLRGLLAPYYKQMKPGSRKFYEDLTAGIMTLFRAEDASAMNRPLDDNFVLGYYLQCDALNQKSNENKTCK